MTSSNRDEDRKNANSLFQRRFLCRRRPRILRSLVPVLLRITAEPESAYAGAFQPGRIKVPPWFQRPNFLRPGLFGLYPSSLSKSVGFVSLSGKASLVSISAAILFLRSWHVYFPLEFEFRGKKLC